ncbi:vanadium-dependent haloperoxidase [Flavihumibacter solisilvae]|uniref:vanadium-dependent haloperoxidase n=1 Tax=Flavihumibacter solisilvae TaxID=1349421 RepID=UPI00126A6393|nr:vanadium-dependent haloperoxidase [Flavihumibacter solisilvae]
MQCCLLKRSHCLKLVALLVVISWLQGCKKDDWPPKGWPPKDASEESATVLYDWYRLGMQMQLYNTTPPPPPLNSRSYGYIGVGLYEAVRPGIKGSVSLSTRLLEMPAMPEPEWYQVYSWSASANAAMASLFRQFLPALTDANKASIDSLENAYNERFKLSLSDQIISNSQAFGRAVASRIFDWSTTDNFTLSAEGYVIPVFPGSWEPTPPAYANPVGPFLADSRPFLQSTLTATYPAIPFPYSEEKHSKFYKAAKDVYDVGLALTDEQRGIANFWADVGGPGVGYPGPGHIISEITLVLEDHKANLNQAAQIYAKTGIAFKDAFHLIWRIKFTENLLRPITYINNLIDPAWTSHLPTPPYPDYPSGLAGVYTPVMQILKREYGNIPISDRTYVWNGSAPRNYASIDKMVEEAAISRVYAGIHYRFTQYATIDIGTDLGNRIADIKLTHSGKH